MKMEENNRLKNGFFNLRDIETPKSGLQCYTDCYWLCVDGDTTKALFYKDSPQCNRQKNICEWSLKQEQYQNLGLEIVFVPVAFVPIRY